MNDVIILTAIETCSERWNRFTQTAFVCLGRNSLSWYCQVSSRLTAIALPYTRSIWVFPWESQWKIVNIIKCHGRQSRAHLAVSTERVSFRTKNGCLWKPILHFTMGLYSSLHDYIIHITLIATSRISLITSFQHPLSCSSHSVKIYYPDGTGCFSCTTGSHSVGLWRLVVVWLPWLVVEYWWLKLGALGLTVSISISSYSLIKIAKLLHTMLMNSFNLAQIYIISTEW